MYHALAQHQPLRQVLILMGVLAGLALGAPGRAWALTYSCITIDYPGETTLETMLFGINDSEQIVGWSRDSQNQFHSFLYNAGTFSPINYPGVVSPFTEGINNSGQIIGYYQTSTNIFGFLDTGGNFSTLRYPNALSTHAFGINNYGQIVGNYLIDNSSNIHGFIYDNGNFISADYPGAANTDLTGINDFGQMVGYYDMNGRHSFLYNAGSFSSFDDPRGADTTALGINNQGQIVGYSSSGSFLRDSTGTFSSIVCPGTISPTHARGINNKGQIVGEYYVNGFAHGVLATPGPTPFAAFTATLKLKFSPRIDDTFALQSSFTLGAGSNGIAPLTEKVTLTLTGGTGTFTTSIPAGSFTQVKKGAFTFKGTINGVKLDATMTPLGGQQYAFTADGAHADLSGIANPVTVTLTIGDDSGSTAVMATLGRQ
jgi:probable HAF family extracellular repeat protein